MVEGYRHNVKALYAGQVSWFNVWWHDPATAATLLSDARRELCLEMPVVRTEAALNLEAHQYEQAIELANRALLLVDTMHVPQSHEDDRDLLHQIRDEAIAARILNSGMPVESATPRRKVDQ